MWPSHVDALEQTVAVEAQIEDLYAEALHQWIPLAAAAVLPTFTVITADAYTNDDLPPDPDAVASTQAGWDALVVDSILPGVAAIWATAAAEAAAVDAVGGGLEGVLSALTDTRDDFLDVYAAAAKAVPGRIRDNLRSLITNAPQQMSTMDLRSMVRDAVTPGSELLRKTSRRLGYTGASILNHAVMAVAKHAGAADRKTWRAILDERTRDTHWVADGQTVPIDGEFTVGGVPMAFPGDPRAPAREVINCVTGSTQVAWPGQQITDASHRRHTGTFVKFETAAGHRLTVTAKHPILTPGGYVNADMLRPGDEVLATRQTDTPQVGDVPPCADQVYGALSQARQPQRVRSGAVDFHGDVSEGDVVEVVRADGDLGLKRGEYRDRLILGSSTKGGFAGARASDIGADLDWIAALRQGSNASAGNIGGNSVGTALLGRKSLRSEQVGFRKGPDRQPFAAQSADDSVTADTENTRHLQYAYAAGMKPVQLIAVDVHAATHDVYNLSTTQSWYIGNGIAVHNCRCRIAVLAVGEAPRLRRGPAAEARRRAERGVTKDVELPLVAAVEEGTDMTAPVEIVEEQSQEGELFRTFTDCPIAFIGTPTSDRRLLAKDIELSYRSMPVPLMWKRQNTEGHLDAFTVGVIESMRNDEGAIYASGYLLNSPEADEAATQLQHRVTRPSIDIGEHEWAKTDADGNVFDDETWWDLGELEPKVFNTFTSAEIIAMTLVATPAFGDTMLSLNEARESRDPGLLASADFTPRLYPAGHFTDPKLTRDTRPTMNSEGRVYGHIACWNQRHRSVQGEWVVAPHSPSNYSHFHTGSVRVGDGREISVGRLTVNCGHAESKLAPIPASAHYDNTECCWALVRCGEDAHGIWFSGVAAPWATPERIEAGLASPLSGDWRNFGEGLDLVAALSVNTPGFIVRGRDDAYGQPLSLVATLGPGPQAQGDISPLSRDDIKAAVAEALAEARFIAERDEALAAAASITRPKTPDEEIDELLAKVRG